MGEYGLWWSEEFNDGDYATPRQVFEGLWKFREMQLEKMCGGMNRKQIIHIKKVNKVVFIELEQLLDFTDMDR